MIKSQHHAKNHAEKSLKRDVISKADSIIVCESGDVLVNSDIDETVKSLKKDKENYFIVKGELTKK